jgi:hypothetical protein
VRRDGRACTNGIVLPSGYCHMHDPERAAGLRAIRVAGGHARSRARRAVKRLPTDLKPVLESLLAAVQEVHAGKLEPPQATAMASLAGAICRVLQVGELEQRLAALEDAVKRQG